jgi:hypothetical protein
MGTLTITDAGISVQITRLTRSPTQEDFGSLLFLDSDATPTPRVKAYTSMAAVAADYSAGDEAYKAAQFFYGQSPSPINFLVGKYDPAEAIADELDIILAANSAFYGVAANVAQRDSSKITDIAAWVNSNNRFLVHSSNDALCKDDSDTTNILYLLLQTGYARVYGHYSSEADQYPCVGAFAIMATTSYRGTNTLKNLKFKDIVGATAESLTPNELQAIQGFSGNVLFSTAGIRMVDAGRCADGQSWIDEVIGTDALAEEIRVRVFGLLARTGTKIAYTEAGMSLIKAEVTSALLQYETNGFLAIAIDDNGDVLPAFIVTSLPVRTASIGDKSARIAPDVQFVGRLAGAINTILISGNLVLN